VEILVEMSKRVKTFKDLTVWQKAFELCLEIYRVTRTFPPDERFGMTAEMRKTARSLPCNIAEGNRRKSTAEYVRFLGIATGSGGELETLILMSSALEYIRDADLKALIDLYTEVDKMLESLIRILKKR